MLARRRSWLWENLWNTVLKIFHWSWAQACWWMQTVRRDQTQEKALMCKTVRWRHAGTSYTRLHLCANKANHRHFYRFTELCRCLTLHLLNVEHVTVQVVMDYLMCCVCWIKFRLWGTESSRSCSLRGGRLWAAVLVHFLSIRGQTEAAARTIITGLNQDPYQSTQTTQANWTCVFISFKVLPENIEAV